MLEQLYAFQMIYRIKLKLFYQKETPENTIGSSIVPYKIVLDDIMFVVRTNNYFLNLLLVL